MQTPPVITAIFEPNLRSCAITVVSSAGGFTYEGLAVKWINGLTKAGDRVLQVFIPSAADIGHNLMVAFDLEVAMDYRKSS